MITEIEPFPHTTVQFNICSHGRSDGTYKADALIISCALKMGDYMAYLYFKIVQEETFK